MSTINYAISKVRQHIPTLALEQTFFALLNHRTRIPITLESRIQDEVIQKMVLPDMNVIGGTTIIIPLNECTILEQDQAVTVFQIPSHVTDNRQITSVMEMMTPGTGLANSSFNSMGIGSNGSEIGTAAMQQLNSMKSMQKISEGRTKLINSNTVMVEGSYYYNNFCMLKVVVGHDNGLSSIDHRNSLAFAELVVLATKAYIYNTNIIEINEGVVLGGAQMGVYKDIVDGFSDALEMYHDYLRTTWAKVDKLNDHLTRNSLISLMVGRPM